MLLSAFGRALTLPEYHPVKVICEMGKTASSSTTNMRKPILIRNSLMSAYWKQHDNKTP